jgi:hypothetical protein
MTEMERIENSIERSKRRIDVLEEAVCIAEAEYLRIRAAAAATREIHPNSSAGDLKRAMQMGAGAVVVAMKDRVAEARRDLALNQEVKKQIEASERQAA